MFKNLLAGEIFFGGLSIVAIVTLVAQIIKYGFNPLLAVLILVLILVPIRLIQVRSNRRQQSWEGVVDKKYVSLARILVPDANDIWRVTFRTLDDQLIDWNVNRWNYQKYTVGDKVIKKKGNLNPEIIS